ncbi:hypothetical protein B0A49_09293 [Cryomyces minteri]|uniref:Uncharacterized protein n=1 Tax=Cryomyces minteri TaxID=331657 RepID=A0A4U0WK88_9PEZI|nr:hypothetical protein B0A49_09293 [Cryomyces minteri]
MEDDAQSIRQSPVPIAATEDNGSNPELPLEESRDSNWQQNPSESDEVEPTPAAPAIIVQTIPEDPNLTDADFPPPFLSPSTTPSPPDTSDPAALIYRNKFAPLPDPHLFIRALTRIAPSRRTTADLYDLATNTQAALKLWQDEYLQLDKHTAPLSAIPKRPATGGRLPLDPLEFEDLKEADLYDYTFDPKRVGFQDPFRQRIGRLDPGGRELRQRRARDVLDAAGASEYDDNDAGIVIGGRTLRDRTAAHSAGTPDPASRSRKRANSSEPDRDLPPPKKRGRQVGARAGIDFLHPRVREMRGQSVTQSVSTDDDDEGADDGSTFGGMSADGARSASRGRKGRPPGSKNVARRSDAGVKKGPRKAGLASSAAFGGADADGTSGFGQAEAGVTGTETGARAGTGTGAAQPPKRRQRVKSEKRSTSMTEWWAKRKAKAAEEKIKELRARGVLVPKTGQDRPQSQSQSQAQSQVPSQSQSQSQATAQMWGEGEGRVGTQRQVECPMEAGFAEEGTGLRGAEMERVREFLQRGG